MAVKIIRGASVTIAENDYNLPNIMEELQISMDEDPEDAEELSSTLISNYAEYSEEQKQAANQTLIDVCGYGMRSLLLKAGAEQDLVEALGIQYEEPSDEESDDGT